MTSTVGITTATASLDRALLDAAGLQPGGACSTSAAASATRRWTRRAGSGRPASRSVSTTL